MCRSDYVEFEGACYKRGITDKHAYAEDHCVKDGAHLVSIHSQEENDFVMDLGKSLLNT